MLPNGVRVLYLHGFASSPASRKARFFTEQLGKLGFRVDVPDLARGNFQQLTITGQLQALEDALCGEPAFLIGSSLGGYLAALYAALHPEVQQLVLLAPAFNFHELWTERLGPAQLAAWRQNGTLSVFHYGEQREIPVGYQLMEDASRFDAFPGFQQPAIIFHGTQDASVPLAYSELFVGNHANACLLRLESGHELTDVLETIWKHSRTFFLTRATTPNAFVLNE